MTFGISLTIEPIHILEFVPQGIHIVCNTGEQLETKFEINGVMYELVNCDLTPGRYIDTICQLKVVPN